MKKTDFHSWLLGKELWFKGLPIVSIFIFLWPNIAQNFSSDSFINMYGWLSEEEHYKIVGHIAQILFIVFVVFIMKPNHYEIGEGQGQRLKDYIKERFNKTTEEDKTDQDKQDKKDIRSLFNTDLSQFHGLWQWVWCIWFLVYLIFAIRQGVMQKGEEPHFIIWIAIDLLNIASSVLILLMYRVLSDQTVELTNQSKDAKEKENKAKSNLYKKRMFIILSAVAAADISVYTLLPESYPLTPFFRFLVQVSIGLFATVSFAGLIGKLNSRFIGAPQYILILLYGYAALQMLFPFIETKFGNGIDREVVLTIMTTLAFLLKIVLFLAISWILETGRLTYYFACISHLNRVEEKNFEKFHSLRLDLPNYGSNDHGDTT